MCRMNWIAASTSDRLRSVWSESAPATDAPSSIPRPSRVPLDWMREKTNRASCPADDHHGRDDG